MIPRTLARTARASRALARPAALALLALCGAAQQAPSAGFTTDPTITEFEAGGPLLVRFLDASLGDVTAWSWSFGDGATSTERNPSHLYFFGIHDVSLTVTGPGGSSTLTRVGLVSLTPNPPGPLSTFPVPLPDTLGDLVANMDRAVELGKALFWDVQVGSDGATACASCHFHAGADGRHRNTLHPGADGTFAPTLSGRGGGPNTTLNAGDFPFRKWLDPNDGFVPLGSTLDRRGATGVFKKTFQALGAGAVDQGLDLDDDLFHVNGTDTLQATGRDAPTVIGAVYFHRLFWDGRANHFFNGRNVWGNADTTGPTVLERLPDGSLGEVALLMNNGALASQAIGPPLSGVEMSWDGRGWKDLGRKLVGKAPLAGQTVATTDSVLGALARPGGPGLNSGLRYEDMIRAAFHERWWGSGQLTADGYSQMEANFSLFFGLAILCYESTLIPDQTPFDRFAAGDTTALGESEKRGLSLFLGRGFCIGCHISPMFAGALAPVVIDPLPPPGEIRPERLVERMAMGRWLTYKSLTFAHVPGPGDLPLDFNPYRRPVRIIAPTGAIVAATTLPSGLACPEAAVDVFPLAPTSFVSPDAGFVAQVIIENDGNCRFRITVDVEWGALGPPGGDYTLLIGGRTFPFFIPQAGDVAVYDSGFYNVGLTPTIEDLGVGANGPFGPLSITRRLQNGEDIGQAPELVGFVMPNERITVRGSFKTPTLRNVELTGPYFHDGSIATLEQVVEFYARGTDFADENRRDFDPALLGFAITEQDKADLVNFLHSLTDPRVRHEQAPFDHPSLPVKVGHAGDHQVAPSDAQGNALVQVEVLPAVGAAGGPDIGTFEDRLAASISVGVLWNDETGARVGFLCDKRPDADVTVQLGLSNPGAGTLSTAQVVFTPADFRATRFVDLFGTAGGPVTLLTSAAASADPDFSGLAVADVPLVLLPGAGPAAPVAGFAADVTAGDAPLTVQFSDTSTGDVTGWAWDFGDGVLSSQPSPAHTYASPGTYTVTLTVTGPGGSDTVVRPDLITAAQAGALQVDFFANVTQGRAPLRVRFQAFNVEGMATLGTFDFGDGATAQVSAGNGRAVHRYASPGVYTVTLTATDGVDTDVVTKVGYITVTP